MGDYLVLAENPYGEDMTSCTLSLNMTPGVDDSSQLNPDSFKELDSGPSGDKSNENKRLIPPKVVIPLQNAKIEEGNCMRLACKIDGFPKPKVLRRW